MTKGYLVNVGSLMRELGVGHTSQAEFLSRVGIRPVLSENYGRGQSMFILPSEADQLRRRADEARASGVGRGWWGDRSRLKPLEGQLTLPEMVTDAPICATAPTPKPSLMSRIKRAIGILMGRTA